MKESAATTGARKKLIATMLQMMPEEGQRESLAPGLKLYRLDQPRDHGHIVYEPALCVIIRGQKHVKVGNKSLTYDEGQVLFAGIPSPAEVEIIRPQEGPFLGLMVELSLEALTRMMLDLIDSGYVVPAPPDEWERGLFVVPMTEELEGALSRLLENASEPSRHRVLYAHSLQEVLFHLLMAPSAQAIFHFLSQDSAASKIIRSARYIDGHYEESLSVSMLSHKAGMSESSYYEKFRKITSLTPMQYVKRIRLHRARLLIANAAGVTEAALTVGYNSPSQFSRDFRRTYGLTPSAFQHSCTNE